MSSEPLTNALSPLQSILPIFTGYPYLVTRVVPVLYHFILLPGDASARDLRDLAMAQWRANRLQTCLVLGEAEATFIDNDRAVDTRFAPRGGIPVIGQLHPPTRLPATAGLLERLQCLKAWTAARTPRQHSVMGDLTKGSREASAADLAELRGSNENGVPRGLVRCPRCSQWRGHCLDPAPERAGLVVEACCPCQADNRCAACGQLLYELRLNANYYEPADGQIWHVPGFCGFGHTCGTLTRRSG